jgi:branched-chain amino acid transport system substrate-binding protein
MKNFLIYLVLVFNLMFFHSSCVHSKIVGNKIILGSVISLTGKYSSEGIIIQNNFNQIIDNINNSGGIKIGTKKYNFQLVFYDNQSNFLMAQHLAKRLIRHDGIQMIIGSNSIELTKALIPITEGNNIVLLELFDLSPLVVKKSRNLFSINFASDISRDYFNPFLVLKDAFEKSNSLDINKIEGPLNEVIQYRNYISSSQ